MIPNISVKLTIRDCVPKVNNPAFEHLLPRNLVPQYVSAEISGVSNAISNGLRRVIACELQVRTLNAEYEAMVTSDPHHIPEMILQRLKTIPLMQSFPDATFELDVANPGPVIRDVKSSEIRIVTGKQVKNLPFNETFTLFTLAASKAAKISPITITSSSGYIPGSGMCVLAANVVSLAIDQQPINYYERLAGDGQANAGVGRGIPSRMSCPRVWQLAFTSNGTMPGRDIIAAACNNIIGRTQAVRELLYSIESVSGATSDALGVPAYSLTIPGESHTIGNLLTRTIADLYPEIGAVTYVVPNIDRVCIVKVRCVEDVKTVFAEAIKHIVSIYARIRGDL